MDNDKKINSVVKLDQELRKIIPQYFVALKQLNEPEKASALITEHISMMNAMLQDLNNV